MKDTDGSPKAVIQVRILVEALRRSGRQSGMSLDERRVMTSVPLIKEESYVEGTATPLTL